MSSIWYEKYKPQKVQDVVLPQKLKDKIQGYVNKKDIPSMLLSSNSPGTGKSSLSSAIISEMKSEALWINASLERGIDVLRGKIQKFASSSSFDDNLKTIVLDECLEENEKVRIGTLDKWVGTPLNTLEKGTIYDCVSFNMDSSKYENDTCEIISDKVVNIFEVVLEDGRSVKVTEDHPFIVLESGENIEKKISDGLSTNDLVICTDKNQKVLEIKSMGKARVINLTVHKNHTFVTENGIVTHNCDNTSHDLQAALRGFIDEFSSNARFILTCNYPDRLIEPLLNRLEVYDFDSLDKKEMLKPTFEKLKFILDSEGIEYDPKDVQELIKQNYPSIRGMISDLQKFSSSGKLEFNQEDLGGSSSFDDVMRAQDYMDMLERVNALSTPSSMFTHLYNDLSLFKESSLPQVVVTLAKYQEMNSHVRDKHLNLGACLTELWKHKN